MEPKPLRKLRSKKRLLRKSRLRLILKKPRSTLNKVLLTLLIRLFYPVWSVLPTRPALRTPTSTLNSLNRKLKILIFTRLNSRWRRTSNSKWLIMLLKKRLKLKLTLRKRNSKMKLSNSAELFKVRMTLIREPNYWLSLN
jgi:hypothetical protein